MTKDEALKLALEALELHGKQYPHMVKGYCLDAITAIKQARSAPVQEPVAIHCKAKRENNGVCPNHNLHCGWPKCNDTTPPAAQPTTEESSAVKPAAPVQEPDHGDELTIAYMSGVHRGKELAAQRQWVGLTRAECLQIEKDMRKYYDYQHECKTVCLPEFAKAIEAKLKEKNT